MVSASAAPFLLPAGACSIGAPIRFIGKQMLVKIPASITNGEFSVLEDLSPPKSGPPLHAHAFEEWFYILEGDFVFEMDGQQVAARPGDIAHAPSNVPHTFENVGQSEGRILLIARPGGLEHYFQALSAKMMHDPSDVAGLAAIGAQYGVKVLGPPMNARGGKPQG